MISLRKGPGHSPGDGVAPTGDAATRQRSRLWWTNLTLAVLAGILMMAILVASGLLWAKKSSLDNEADAGAGASARACFVEAAEDSMTRVLNVSADNLDEQVRDILDGATGAFQQQFEAGADQYKTLVRDADAESVGRVVVSAVQENDDRKATVLVLGTREVTNANVQTPLEEDYRAILVVEKVDGVCKTAKMDWAIA